MRTAARPAARSAALATGRTPALARSLGSKPSACRVTTPTSSSRLGSGTVSLSRNRSSWASGSGYVPSYSIGFCVAATMNGSGSGRGTPSIETCRSSIASSSEACVLGGVRLISSASSRLVKTGPGRNENSADRAS